MERNLNDSQFDIIEELNKALNKVNWAIAIPDGESIDHLVIGRIEKIEQLVRDLPYEYEVMTRETRQ
jgi:hypothetical protein